MIHIRRAGPLDARPLAELLNAIIAQGGTTAMTNAITADTLRGWMAADPGKSAWHLAEDDTGTAIGFQWIEQHPELPADACSIATFVRIGAQGLGTGSALFSATATAARALGYGWIHATILGQNTGGLAYYQSRGFESYRLAHHTDPTKQQKRFDLWSRPRLGCPYARDASVKNQ